MLLRLLRVLDNGGTFSLNDLAKELDVSVGLVVAMVEEMLRTGYLRRVDAACATSCQSCTERVTCADGSPGRIWSLTELGRGVARRGL